MLPSIGQTAATARCTNHAKQLIEMTAIIIFKVIIENYFKSNRQFFLNLSLCDVTKGDRLR